jgi:hypothetical protein
MMPFNILLSLASKMIKRTRKKRRKKAKRLLPSSQRGRLTTLRKLKVLPMAHPPMVPSTTKTPDATLLVTKTSTLYLTPRRTMHPLVSSKAVLAPAQRD